MFDSTENVEEPNIWRNIRATVVQHFAPFSLASPHLALFDHESRRAQPQPKMNWAQKRSARRNHNQRGRWRMERPKRQGNDWQRNNFLVFQIFSVIRAESETPYVVFYFLTAFQTFTARPAMADW
jgi:hypothetical protein